MPLFAASCFLFYFLSSLWFWPIVNGPRTMLALCIPVLWIVGGVIQHPQARVGALPVGTRKRVALADLITFGLTVALIFQTLELVAYRAAKFYGGK